LEVSSAVSSATHRSLQRNDCQSHCSVTRNWTDYATGSKHNYQPGKEAASVGELLVHVGTAVATGLIAPTEAANQFSAGTKEVAASREALARAPWSVLTVERWFIRTMLIALTAAV
jgi:hypothetical protein